MASIEPLKLAYTVLETITFACETITLCRQAYRDRVPEAQLTYHAQSLAKLSTDVHDHVSAMRPQSKSQRILCEIAHKCNIAARALEEELQFLIIKDEKSRALGAWRVAVMTTWRRPRIQKTEKTLRDCERTLQTTLLEQIFKQGDALALQQSEEFARQDERTRHIISAYSAGQSELSRLIISGEASTRAHINQQSRQVEEVVNALVTHTISTAHASAEGHVSHEIGAATETTQGSLRELRCTTMSETRRKTFLQSLKFPSMNQRFSDIEPADEGTFSWILDSTGDLSNEEIEAHIQSQREFDSALHWQSYREWEKSGEGFETSSDESSDNRTNHLALRDERIIQKHLESQSSPPWDDFKNWLRSEGNIYWISGKPGSGKSTLIKFLVLSPKTKEALELWNPEALILSAFLWKPGSPMQKSTKGVLCALIQQLAHQNPVLLDNLIARAESLENGRGAKEEYADWSTQELKDIGLWALRACPSHICVFLDGLDEICDADGPQGILDLIAELRTIPKVKVCVASRAEPAFEATLGRQQHLRLHLLTAPDMLTFTRNMLHPFWDSCQVSRGGQARLFLKLMARAEGVFLWLRIVIRSIRDGLVQGDSYKDLSRRIRELPSELVDLLSDIWERRNGKTSVYRRFSARCLNFLLEIKNIDTKTPPIYPYPLPCYEQRDISVYELAAAMETSGHRFLSPELTRHLPAIEAHCRNFYENLKASCADFIVISHYHVDESENDDFWTKEKPAAYSGLLRFLRLGVQFMNRSVFDFLHETSMGQRIRAFDTSSSDFRQVQLAKGAVAKLMVAPRECSYHALGSIVHGAIYQMAYVRESSLTETMRHILQVCWQWYDEADLEYVHFLTNLALPSTTLYEFLASFIRQSANPAALATRVLREFHVYYETLPFVFSPPTGSDSIFKSLVSLGADLQMEDFDSRMSRTGKPLGTSLIVPLPLRLGFAHRSSALGSFLEEAVKALSCPVTNKCHAVDRVYLKECLEVLHPEDLPMGRHTCLTLELRRSSDIEPCGAHWEGEVGLWWARLSYLGFDADLEARNKYLPADSLTVEVNYAFLLQFIYARLGYGPEWDMGSSLRPTWRNVEPFARVHFITCEGGECILMESSTESIAGIGASTESTTGIGTSTYQVLDEGISSNILDILQPWLTRSHETDLAVDCTERMESLCWTLGQEAAGSLPGYQRYHGKIIDFLLTLDCGYARVAGYESPNSYSRSEHLGGSGVDEVRP